MAVLVSCDALSSWFTLFIGLDYCNRIAAEEVDLYPLATER